MDIEISKEAAEMIARKDAERAAKVAERNAAFRKAFEEIVIESGGDRSRFIYHVMPSDFGGGVIHRLPGDGYWAAHQKRLLMAATSDGKKGDPTVAIAGLVEEPKLLQHPPLADLQDWRRSYPGLYTTIHEGITIRCDGSSPGKG